MAGFDYTVMIKQVPAVPDGSGSLLPYLAVDECCDNTQIRNLISSLMKLGLTLGADPLWDQQRVGPDGSMSYWLGGLSKDSAKVLGERSVPAKGFKCDDRHVVAHAVAMLFYGAPIVLLSENTRNDESGLRRLLREQIGPALNSRASEGLSLTTLFKKGKTSYPDYCTLVFEQFKIGKWRPGYSEHVL